MATKTLKIGDKVSWNSPQGKVTEKPAALKRVKAK